MYYSHIAYNPHNYFSDSPLSLTDLHTDSLLDSLIPIPPGFFVFSLPLSILYTVFVQSNICLFYSIIFPSDIPPQIYPIKNLLPFADISTNDNRFSLSSSLLINYFSNNIYHSSNTILSVCQSFF